MIILEGKFENMHFRLFNRTIDDCSLLILYNWVSLSFSIVGDRW